MLDYYGSIVKQKEDIYDEIHNIFSNYDPSYISSILESSGYIDKAISVSGWYVFHLKNIVNHINQTISKDLQKSKDKLIMTRCLHVRPDCNTDLMEKISTYM